eukprot:scaffold923_cov171-Amphora_coffeaeformis.AAC.18
MATFLYRETDAQLSPRSNNAVCNIKRKSKLEECPVRYSLACSCVRFVGVVEAIVEMQKDFFVVNGVHFSYKDSLPFSHGPATIVQAAGSKSKQVCQASFLGSSIEFKFYNHGHPQEVLGFRSRRLHLATHGVSAFEIASALPYLVRRSVCSDSTYQLNVRFAWIGMIGLDFFFLRIFLLVPLPLAHFAHAEG